MNILSITIGVLLFIGIICFAFYTFINIKQSKSLFKYFKIICWIGVGILATMMITGLISKSSNLFMSLVFVNYIKAVYYAYMITGFIFFIKKTSNIIKAKFFKIKVIGD